VQPAHRGRPVIAVLVAGLLATATPVEQAKSLYKAGGAAYKLGDYPTAIRAFEEARRLAPRPPIIFSLAQSYRLQYFVDSDPSRLESAVTLYRQYLGMVSSGGRRDHAAQHVAALAPILERVRRQMDQLDEGDAKPAAPKIAQLIVASGTGGAIARVTGQAPQPVPATFELPPGTHQVTVEAPEHTTETLEAVAVAGSVVALNVDLEGLPGALQVTAPDGAAIMIDGRTVGVTPLPAPIQLPAGAHTLAVTDRGHEPFVQPIDMQRGGSVSVTAQMAVTNQRIVAHVLFVGAALLAAGSGVATGFALDAESDALAIRERFDNDESLRETEVSDYANHVARRADITQIAVGAGAGAGVAALTALFLYLFDTPAAPAIGINSLSSGSAPAGLSIGF